MRAGLTYRTGSSPSHLPPATPRASPPHTPRPHIAWVEFRRIEQKVANLWGESEESVPKIGRCRRFLLHLHANNKKLFVSY